MRHSLDQVAWPVESLGDALLALAKFAKLPHQPTRLVATLAKSVGERDDTPRSGERGYECWLEAAAERIGLEAESVAAFHRRAWRVEAASESCRAGFVDPARRLRRSARRDVLRG